MKLLRSRKVWVVLAVLVCLGAVAWRYQSRIIGVTAGWYLDRVAEKERASGDVTQRRELVSQVHRFLLIAMPPDALIPELYDYLTLLSQRVATGEVNWSWGAYLYTGYLRDAMARPADAPEPTRADMQQEIERAVEFFYLQARPDGGLRVTDLIDTDSISVDDIEAAHREGRDLGSLAPAGR